MLSSSQKQTAMAFNKLHLSTILIILTISTCFANSHLINIATKIFHRDSPTHSPLYNPTLSPIDRIRQELARSRSTSNVPKANIMANRFGTAYLMNISIGTPPVTIVAFADTGSDLIWTQCTPCHTCFNQTLPLFQPAKSSTYSKFPCNSSVSCPPTSSTQPSCSSTSDNVCMYDVLYGDNSSSNGALARETITMDSISSRHPVKLHKYIFGCGRENNGFFDGASGIVGLGGGYESLVSQLGSKIDGKFAYCLPEDVDAVSKITFGRNAVATGEGVVKTRLFNIKGSTFYFLALKRFTVGGVDVPVSLLNDTMSNDPENIVIDSGTTLTLLPSDTYSKFESALSKQINGADRVADPTGILSLCYKGNFTSPKVNAHFLGDAVVKLEKINLFLRTNPDDDVFCLAFAPADGFIPIYGNVAQKNFLIAFDRTAQTLSFKPTDCTKAATAGVTAT